MNQLANAGPIKLEASAIRQPPRLLLWLVITAVLLLIKGQVEKNKFGRGIEDYAARDAGIDNLVTADDLARLMLALSEGRLASREATAACERTLTAQTYRDGIPAGLPPGIPVGNKTGWIDGVNHDVALWREPGRPPVGVAVLVTAPGTPSEREAGIARITRSVWASLVPQGPPLR